MNRVSATYDCGERALESTMGFGRWEMEPIEVEDVDVNEIKEKLKSLRYLDWEIVFKEEIARGLITND